MTHAFTTAPVSLRALRWTARIWSILAVGLILVFAVGEGMNLSRFSARELVLFGFFPLGVCVGMVVAWWREGLGGGLTVLSFAAFYLAEYLKSSHFPRGLAMEAIAAPGVLFVICSAWDRASAGGKAGRRVRRRV